MYLINSNIFFRFRQRYVYIGRSSCHTLLTVVPFGIAVSKKTVTDERDYTGGPLDTCLMTFLMDMIVYVIR